MTTLFISDLHLEAARPDMTDAFLQLLNGEARDADALYILGDLFESWVGDDVSMADHPAAIAGLRELSQHGVPIYVLRGNRDFLLGSGFEQATGSRLLPDASTITLYGQRLSILHGDVLCTDDLSYQRFRRVTQLRWLQKLFLSLPAKLRRRFAVWLREQSQLKHQRRSEQQEHEGQQDQESQQKNDITDVNPQAVQDYFHSEAVDCMVHGHTHRPAIHHSTTAKHKQTRIVLGDWYEQASMLRWSANGYELDSFPLASS